MDEAEILNRLGDVEAVMPVAQRQFPPGIASTRGVLVLLEADLAKVKH